ncbi:MAG: class I SAM-dependent methyltransferase [Ignavibacteria bacterium]|nr:class I SAM-dependent methyltransferase [Ignavibacteria bacterium]
MKAKGFKDYFSQRAADYARYRPQYPEELFRYLASLVARHDLAWDCATGNGQAAQGLVPFFKRVVATDASIRQIEHAYPHDRIDYIVASAERSPLESSSVDLIAVATAVHWFDFDRFYAEVDRVLRPDGVIAVWCYGWTSISPGIDAVTATYGRDVVGPYWPPERRFVDEGYRTIPFPFMEIPSPPFTLEREWTMEELIGYWETWSATRMYSEQHHAHPADEVREKLEMAWGDPAAKRLVRWPLHLRAGRKKDLSFV